ncbi:eukaryotic translation initiation factor eIF2A-domain-containing protein [Multifurca ochricompacta]|uniref:Eukaryotic translation initiation factor 2A n=1 Tax=Multifurca ochricompacta TaxID=376703 RepID=A0AAD4LYK9_9AGAM|nr:eukaryotic translation initiation factor eIF2A-domain-containing protein [Multifurca ochricompacta]
MSQQVSQQYAFRAQKFIGLVSGTPTYTPIEAFQAPDAVARMYQYSPDGRLFALAVPSGVRIHQAENAVLLQELAIPNVIELSFSPRGTYLSTWERHVKLEDGAQHKNLRVFSVSTGEELISFSQKHQDSWDVQYTISESHAIRLVGQEIHVFNPAEWGTGIVNRLRVDGASSVTLSPGLNPSVAVFVPEKKGQPANVSIHSLLNLSAPPTCQKTFFKAEKSQIKWNNLGTQVLVLTQTDVDSTNKSYYGQSGLYLLSAAGNFDCRISLDKEGPIHDFAWSPNSKEFGVVYGFMPARVMLFDQRVRTLHDFGTSFCNYILFNPQSRLILLGGFGNLAGKIDIYDRRSLTKISTIDASNTSYCEWSPDGKFILTATLSPRLRVDNGIKVWYLLGQLIHAQDCEDLYQVSWRPTLVDAVPPFPAVIPPAPTPSASVQVAGTNAKPSPAKPLGAYRPPGARGQGASFAYSREGDNGSPAGTPRGSGTATPTRQGRSPASPPNGQGRRYVPGAPGSLPPNPDNGKPRKRKGLKERGEGSGRRDGGIVAESPAAVLPVLKVNTGELEANEDSVPPTPGLEPLDPVQKKVRNLNKKLKAIDDLKEKAARGERLEATQLKKIESEADIRKELATLGVSP